MENIYDLNEKLNGFVLSTSKLVRFSSIFSVFPILMSFYKDVRSVFFYTCGSLVASFCLIKTGIMQLFGMRFVHGVEVFSVIQELRPYFYTSKT